MGSAQRLGSGSSVIPVRQDAGLRSEIRDPQCVLIGRLSMAVVARWY